MARSDARAAQAVVGRLLGTYPSFAPGWLTASMLALNSGNIAEARRHVERGLALEPAHPQLLVQHVRILYMGGDVAEAQAAALASEPSLSTHPQMQRALGTAAVSLGLHDLALRLLTGAAAALPQDPSITRTIAMCLRFLGRFDDAEAALDRLLVMEPQAWGTPGLGRVPHTIAIAATDDRPQPCRRAGKPAGRPQQGTRSARRSGAGWRGLCALCVGERIRGSRRYRKILRAPRRRVCAPSPRVAL
jgi:tetratricopeptide (TPR) repeat protein